MFAFICRRLALSFVVMGIVSVISFAMITLSPGSPFPWGDLNPQIAPAVKEEYRKRFHLDQPWHAQYRLIIADLFSARLVSMKDGRPVIAKNCGSIAGHVAPRECRAGFHLWVRDNCRDSRGHTPARLD
jgi:ABC-type dipeptide/oligopeptide/nickel transport system permease component